MQQPEVTTGASRNRPSGERLKLLEFGPLAFTILAVALKLAYFSYLVPGEWWASEERVRDWLRPTFHLLGFVVTHPQVLTATLGGVLVLLAPLPLVSRTWRFAALLTFNFIATTLGVADLVHARFYGDVLSVSDLLLAPSLGGVLPSILTLLHPTDVLYYADVLLGCAIIPAYLKLHRSSRVVHPRPSPRVSAGLALGGVFFAAPTGWLMWQTQGEFFSDGTVRVEAAAGVGILPYHLADIVAHLHGTSSEVDRSVRTRVYRFLTERDNQRELRSPLAAIARGR